MHCAAQVKVDDLAKLKKLIFVAGSVCKDWSSVGLLVYKDDKLCVNLRQCKGFGDIGLWHDDCVKLHDPTSISPPESRKTHRPRFSEGPAGALCASFCGYDRNCDVRGPTTVSPRMYADISIRSLRQTDGAAVQELPHNVVTS